MNMSSSNPAAERDAHRARYEALRAAGQRTTAQALPTLSDRHLSIAASQVLHRETIPGGWYWSVRVARGEALRIVNPSGRSTVSLIAWCAADTSERLNTADTMKVQWNTGLRRGRVIYTEMGRVAFSVIEDTSGAHDSLMGSTTRESMFKALGEHSARNARDNFFAAAAKYGLTRRDVPACINFFAPVSIDGNGRFVWRAEQRTADDFVDLRAEMDMLVVLSNAGHPLDPELSATPAAVQVVQFVAPQAAADDLCRHACSEVERAFEFTERYIRRRSQS
ncbi:MAG: urea amidolyase associated protein UAAP1 [Janthinobacterium lividum]